jgi:hypothetical protein
MHGSSLTCNILRDNDFDTGNLPWALQWVLLAVADLADCSADKHTMREWQRASL